MINLINKLLCRILGHTQEVYRPRITNAIRANKIQLERFRVAREYRCGRCGKLLSQSFSSEMNRKKMEELRKRFTEQQKQSK